MVDNKIKNELIRCLGKDQVFDQSEYRIAYSYDATGSEFLPDVVVFPTSERDMEQIIAIAYKHKVPLTPRGAGVGYSGGSVPVSGGISMVFTRMNQILAIDTDNFTAVVEPGVVTYHLQQAVEKKGLFYPPDPASLKTSTIGGNVAENAGGLRCFKYGVTGNYVLGLEAFLIDGRKIKTGGYVIKNVAGYDIKSLLVGSEGTLAVISKIILRLIPLPQYRRLFRVDFSSLKKGAEFINRMVRENISPSVLEFMDETSITAVCEYQDIPLEPAVKASALVEIDGNPTDVMERSNHFIQLLSEFDVLSYKMAETEAEQERLWSIRRNISPAVSKLKPKKINEDIVVPIDKIPDTVDYINGLSKEYGIKTVLFGHFGDGNIHTNLLVDPRDKDEMDRAEKALDKIFRYVIAVNGSISGEHGIGIAKKPFMKYQFTETEMDVFKSVKHAFDPFNLLNPGKIF
ncbi:MAG: FAD-binding oxidoreductase [Candidatus Omnitrophota bacterium]